MDLEQGTRLLRLLADASRLRLLMLLEEHELSVAELTAITKLAQSRVSSHLARLREFELVRDRRVGSAALYSATTGKLSGPLATIWQRLREGIDDAQLRTDREAARELVARRRHGGQTWAESVAGRMELHYSPGRTWEATARTLLQMLDLGEVLDIASGDGVVAELLHGRCRHMVCVDISPTVLRAARDRLAGADNVGYVCADMHALPLPDARFDHVLLLHALSYSRRPQAVVAEAARVLRPGGRLVVAALAEHRQESVLEVYDHANLGLAPSRLRGLLEDAGLSVTECAVSTREPRPPFFEVISAVARRP